MSRNIKKLATQVAAVERVLVSATAKLAALSASIAAAIAEVNGAGTTAPAPVKATRKSSKVEEVAAPVKKSRKSKTEEVAAPVKKSRKSKAADSADLSSDN